MHIKILNWRLNYNNLEYIAKFDFEIGDALIEDAFKITGMRLYKNKKGIYYTKPPISRFEKKYDIDPVYYSNVSIINESFRYEFNEDAKKSYNNWIEGEKRLNKVRPVT